MVETFYKIEVTQEKYTESAEYYTLALIHFTGSFYVDTEHHGWWDNVADTARLKTTILSNAEEPTRADEARRIYDEQRSYLASQGFIHVLPADAMNRGQQPRSSGAVTGKRRPYDVESEPYYSPWRWWR